MATQRIDFTEWTPDQASIVKNLSDAKNVVATVAGYNPFPTAVNYSQAASENLNSGFAARYSSTTSIFAGGTTKLFKLDGADFSMDDVSKSGGYTGVEKWNFCQFGNTVIAANNINKLQAYTTTAFADLAAAAPVAKYVTVVRDFVVAGNLDGGTNANKVAWSDINDETDWTPSSTSQSDSQVLPDGGNITGLTGGEFGLILMERAIVRMTYSGSPYFFQFDTISKNLGCTEGNSVTKYGNTTYFLAEDGFYACDGQSVIPIGTQKVDRWFYGNANPSLLNTMSATTDPFRKIVIWNFANTFGGRSLLIYNWQVNKWTYGETTVDYLASVATAGQTLEGIDLAYEVTAGSFTASKEYTISSIGTTDFTLIGAYANTVGVRFTATGAGTGTGKAVDLAAAAAAGKTLDTLTTSLDNPLYAGGKFFLGGVDGAYVVSFTGANASAVINTGYFGSQYNSTVTLARPIVDNGSADVAIFSVNMLNEVKDYSSYTSASSENRVPLRSNGKYHSISLKPTGSRWSNALAVEVEYTPQGTR